MDAVELHPVPAHILKSRLSICYTCPLLTGTTCAVCGCDVAERATFDGMACPLPEPLWGVYISQRQTYNAAGCNPQ